MSKLDSTNRGISERFGKTGQLISLQAKITLGTAGRYVYRSKTAKLDPALTPAKARAAAKKQLETWMDTERKQYDEYAALCASGELSEAECADYTLYLKNLEEARQSAASASRAKKLTFTEFVNEHWLPDHIRDGTHSPSTVANNEYHAARLILYFGEMKLENITTEVVKRYINTLRTEPLSGTSQFHRFNTLRNILRYGYQMGYLPVNPLDKLPSSQIPHKERHKLEAGKDFLSPEQVQRFLECLKEEPTFYRTMVNLMIFTGLRRGEVAGLQWEDIDLTGQTLTVVRNVTRDTKSPDHIHVGRPKTAGSARTVALPPYMEAVQKAHRDVCRVPAQSMEQCKGRAGQRPAHCRGSAERRHHGAGGNLGRLESRRVHGRARRKSPVSGGTYPQQQGRRQKLYRVILWTVAGKAARSTVTHQNNPAGGRRAGTYRRYT